MFTKFPSPVPLDHVREVKRLLCVLKHPLLPWVWLLLPIPGNSFTLSLLRVSTPDSFPPEYLLLGLRRCLCVSPCFQSLLEPGNACPEGMQEVSASLRISLAGHRLSCHSDPARLSQGGPEFYSMWGSGGCLTLFPRSMWAVSTEERAQEVSLYLGISFSESDLERGRRMGVPECSRSTRGH